MLDSEHPNTDQSAQAEPEPTATAPTRRRRAARRPAGPPSAVAETSAVSEVDSTGTTSPEAAPVAEAPVAEPAPKRTRRSRAKVAEPAQEPMIAADAGVAPTPEPEPAPAVEPVPAEPEPARKTTRKRRVARPAEPVAEPPADHDEVAASLAELAHSGRARTRKAGLAQSIGLDEEATPDQVLDSLAAVIGGRLVQAEPEAAEETDEETDDSAADAAEADELLEDEDSAAEGDEAEAEAEGDDATPRRRRRRRGGRRRRRGAGEGTADAEGDGDGEESDEGEPAATEDSTADAGDEPAAEGTSRRRRRRRRRGEDSADGEDDGVDVVVRVREPRRRSSVSDEVTGIEGSTRMEAKKQRRREGRAAGRRRAPILSESEFLARRESVERTMLIRQAEDYSQIAVMEDGILVEHYVDRASATSMIGNIYLGRVQNVLPSMEAAFVDIGRGRNAVLYAGEVDWDSFGVTGADKKVEKVFKSGQQVLVQVSKDPVGAKGARLTSHISIPGRYVVYSPGGHLSGISRKLPESERKRLKSILDELIGPDASVIVRTAAEGASEDELVRDVNRLKAQWEVLEKKSTSGQAPQLLYAEPDLTVRIVRDLFTEDFGTLIVDGNGAADDAYDTVQAYVEHVAPHLAERLHRWDRSEKGDIFDAHRVHEQVAKALGVTFYDRTLVDLVAQKSGYPLDFVAENDQRITQSMLFQIAISGSVPPWFNGGKAITNRDTLFSAQSKVIRELALENGCVIVGRCANYVLRDVPNHLSVFISGAPSDKIKRCAVEYGIRPDAAEAEMLGRDRDRANYYSHYTGEVWGAAKNYDLAVNSSRFGIEGAVQVILAAQKL